MQSGQTTSVPNAIPSRAGKKNPSVACGKKTVVRAAAHSGQEISTRNALHKDVYDAAVSCQAVRDLDAQVRFLASGDQHIDVWLGAVRRG